MVQVRILAAERIAPIGTGTLGGGQWPPVYPLSREVARTGECWRVPSPVYHQTRAVTQ